VFSDKLWSSTTGNTLRTAIKHNITRTDTIKEVGIWKGTEAGSNTRGRDACQGCELCFNYK